MSIKKIDYDPDNLPPGSPEAVDKGCTCPVMDNGYGKGRGGNGECLGWWIAGDCPIHGKNKEVGNAEV